MGLDLNTALISDTFDGLIKTTDGNALTGSPLVLTDGRGNDSSIAIATAGNGVTITGTLTVGGVDIGGDLATAKSDITAIETKTDFITVTGAVNLDTIKTKADFITVTQAVDLDTIESDIASATAKTQYITVTQAVNLDTMESDILSAKTKTDFITIGQPVNLDNVESGLATAEADIIAIEAKTDYITISSALNLNTVASNASAAKTKTDFLTVTQAVNLDTLESDVNVAKGDITAIEAKTDNITVTQAVNLDTMESDLASSKAKTDFITITQAVNLDTVESGLSQAQTDINLIEAKTNNITVTQAVDLDTMESDIATNNAKNSYPAGDATKVGFISVTQAVDLDSMETDISNLSANKYDKTGGTISGAVTITGDLTVNGTTTTVNTQTLSVKDPLIELANDNSANSVDTGFYANYSEDAGVTTKYAGLFKDAGDSDKFKLFKGLEVEPTTTVDTAGTGYTKGDLVVNDLDAVTISGTLTGNVSGNLTGNVTGDFLGDILSPSVIADGVTATTQSAGDNSTKVATTAYVDSVVTAQDLDFAGDSGTGAVDLDSQSLTIAGTANEIETSASGQTITIGLPSSVTVGILTATTLAGTLSTAAQTNITSVGTLSSLTVAGALNGTISTAAQPNITSVGTLSSLAVSGNLTVDTDTLFVDAANNRVGIGTSTPAAKLESYIVNTGAIGASNNANIALGSNGAVDTRSIMTFGKQISGGYAPAYFGYITTDGTGNSKGDIILGTRNVTTDSAPTERMRIDASGNVGIGTSSPATKLDVYDVIRSSFGASLYTSITSPATGGVSGKIISSDNNLELTADSLSSSTTNILFKTSSSGTTAERMRIDSSGNVGIGSSSPSVKLDVTGASNSDSTARFSKTSEGSLLLGGNRSTSNCPFIGSENAYDFAIITNNTERARFNSTGLSFPNGNGIDFSASAGGGATSSLLDDYEEGTFTPSYATSGFSGTYLNQVGHYTKIGRLVNFQLQLDTTAVASAGSGNIIITGLPYAQTGGMVNRYIVQTSSIDFDQTSYNWYAYFPTSTTLELLYQKDNTGWYPATTSNTVLAGATALSITGTYYV